MKKLLLFLACSFNLSAFAQIPDGSIAPDFTLTDYNGTSHNLYSYLNAGKTVFVEVFAAHCPTCWNYHQTNRLKNMYNSYGPSGTDEIMILALEYDQWNNHDAFIGNGPEWVTQGNWLDGTPYPIFDVEDPNRGVFSDYNVSFYPVIFKICPDRVVERILTSEVESVLYQKVQDCLAALSVDENLNPENTYIDRITKSLVINYNQKVTSVNILSLHGQLIKSIAPLTGSTINIDDLSSGIYLVEIKTENTAVVKKFYLN